MAKLILIGLGTFVAVVLAIEGIGVFLRTSERWNPELKRVKKKLTLLSEEPLEQSYDLILKEKPLSDLPWLNDILKGIPLARKLSDLLLQADIQYSVGVYLLLSLVTAVSALMISWQLTSFFLLSLMVAAGMGILPLLYIIWRKKRRTAKFEEQLPDALMLVARALRAGHAFSSGLHMVAQEFGDPIGAEFERLVHEINYGVPLEESLSNLIRRVDCNDLKFFAISTLVQKETGGNLAEILENISHLIRERFKLHGRIRSLAAEGKLSAIVLTAIPFLLVLLFSITNPNLIKVLITDPIGKTIVFASLAMLFVGIIMMKKMINIKV